MPQHIERLEHQQSYLCNEVVYISSDRKELHACCLAAGGGSHVQRRYVFLGLAKIDFEDTQKTVGWCTHPHCAQTTAGTHVDPQFEGLHSHQLPLQHYAQDTLICGEAAKLLQALGGEQGLNLMLSRPCSPDGAELVVPLEPSVNGTAKSAVRDGPSFRDWAVITQHVTSTAWFCTACQRVHACGHIAAANKNAAAEGAMMMDSNSFEKKLRKDFLPEQGD